MKNVLIIYYTQSGQLKEVAEKCCEPIINDPNVKVDWLEVNPEKPFPYPWSAKEFFDAFPETVMCEQIPIKYHKPEGKKYDLIILAYQPWYLSPSQPISSFLQDDYAKEIFKGTDVVTLIGSRNMWLQAQIKVSKLVKNLGGKVVGNIALFDRSYNLVSVYTILRWMLYGKKGNAGIAKREIQDSSKYGEYLLGKISQNLPVNQKDLVNLGAVEIIDNLVPLEQTAIRLFKLFAKFIKAKGNAGDPKRRFRVRLFSLYLFWGIVLLSPITTVLFYLSYPLRIRKVKEARKHFSKADLSS